MVVPRQLDGETTVVGVIGWPVRHSLSPPMHNAAFAQLGLNWVYVPFEVPPQDVPQALTGVRGLGLAGINVTVPHKEQVAQLVDETDETARVLGVVNTVVNRAGRLYGYTTDGEGFLRSLREAGAEVAGKHIALLGAGGAARAVAYAMAREGPARLVIINRTFQRAEELARLLQAEGACQLVPLALDSPQVGAAVTEADLIVHSTPAGMHPHSHEPPLIPTKWLHAGQWVCDLVYTPRETGLLRGAQAQGAWTIDGTGMLVHQGAIAFELWTGRAAPVETMREALLSALQRREAQQGSPQA